MLDKLLNELARRMETIEKKYKYLSFLINERYANEKLLQLEVMRIISLMPDVIEYLPEKLYTVTSTNKCDFWFKTSDSIEYWMEIKMRPTNYRVMQSNAKHAKAITDSIDSIISDIKRLKEYAPKDAKKYVLFTFYPMYRDNYNIFNKKHLSRISKASGMEITSPNKIIPVGEASFDLYLIEV